MNTHVYQDGKAVTAHSIATAVDAGDLTIPEATELIELLIARETEALRDENARLRVVATRRRRRTVGVKGAAARKKRDAATGSSTRNASREPDAAPTPTSRSNDEAAASTQIFRNTAAHHLPHASGAADLMGGQHARPLF